MVKLLALQKSDLVQKGDSVGPKGVGDKDLVGDSGQMEAKAFVYVCLWSERWYIIRNQRSSY